ncbi:hypothetical protein JTB14_013473 [Gonioctena quinquepunctata]|nr:hypothetical protein JTB14_013473 [Gonioctena quinquepunctata]
MPCSDISPDHFERFSNLKHPDPKFFIFQPVDMLLGADIFGSLLKGSIIKGSCGEPTAVDTIFGWVVIENYIKRLWELKQVPTSHSKAPEDILADKHSRAPPLVALNCNFHLRSRIQFSWVYVM